MAGAHLAERVRLAWGGELAEYGELEQVLQSAQSWRNAYVEEREGTREKVAGEWRDAGIQPAHGLFGPTNAASSAGHWLMSLS